MVFAAVVLALQITGSELVYTVQRQDSLASIGAQFGVDARVIAQTNSLKPGLKLRPGQSLKIDNRHILPQSGDAQILVNIPQRMLFLIAPDSAVVAYPVAAGKTDWETPVGAFSVVTKEENPAWDVPPSIQEEMRRGGKPVVKRIPPSTPENPLGGYWIGLSLPGIGIHGTNAPASVYHLQTHGCVRLDPANIRALFPEIAVGMTGRLIYEPVLLTREGNSVYIEVHPDHYKKDIDPFKAVIEQAFIKNVVPMLDLNLVRDVIRKREGIARDVTLR